MKNPLINSSMLTKEEIEKALFDRQKNNNNRKIMTSQKSQIDNIKKRQLSFNSFIFNHNNLHYNTGYNSKIPLTVNGNIKKVIPERLIYEKYSFEVLDICENTDRFVVNPQNRIQYTEFGGTVLLQRMEVGYEMNQIIESITENPSFSGEVKGLNTGLKLSIENKVRKMFKFNMGKLTHEHLVLIMNSRPRTKYLCIPVPDRANIEIDYIQINKTLEKQICEEITENKLQIETRKRKKGLKKINNLKTISEIKSNDYELSDDEIKQSSCQIQ
jgi:hypothetical protein